MTNELPRVSPRYVTGIIGDKPSQYAKTPHLWNAVFHALGLDAGFADQPVQPYAFSYAIGSVLVVLGVLMAVATWRGDVAQPEEGEDVDLSGGLDWTTLLQLVAVIVVVVALINWLGWAIMGAFLFAAGSIPSTINVRASSLFSLARFKLTYGYGPSEINFSLPRM